MLDNAAIHSQPLIVALEACATGMQKVHKATGVAPVRRPASA
jgi:hypothetical protein